MLITVEDLDSIYKMDAHDEATEGLAEEVQWVDDDEIETDMACLCVEDAEKVEEKL